MAEFTIDEFVDVLREYLYGFFPYENDEINKKKHQNRQLHIRDVAFKNLPVSVNVDMRSFDIGSEYAEMVYPYYHILQDAPVIRKKGRGTTKSRGSQANVETLSARDYSKISFNGKTYSREYQKNVRGKRQQVIDKSTRYAWSNGGIVKINANANAYQNVHYKYIDKTLDYCLPFMATYFNMKMLRKVDSGLEEEYNMQQQEQMLNIIDILDSFGEDDYD